MRSLFLLLIPVFSWAQSNQKVKQYVASNEHQRRWLSEYTSFLSIPNVYGDSVNIYKNAQRTMELLEQRGIRPSLLFSDVKGSSPVFYGEVKNPKANSTIIFYAHYDGQPVNPKQWAEGLAPFTPALYSTRIDLGGKPVSVAEGNGAINPDWRLYGRGAADDKAGVFAIIAAYEALIASGQRPPVNLKFFFEGEEEAGSVNLDKIFQKYNYLLKGDLWIICDGPRHVSGKKQIVFGVRGDVNVDLKVYGASRPLHSGNYGNFAPNPAMKLAQLLATMKDNEGKVLIDGFYDDVKPLSNMEKAALEKIPDVDDELKRDLKLNHPDGGSTKFKELLMVPTLNINGMQSANVGSMASNVIPTEATAVIDLRLVPGNDVDRQIAKLRTHIEKNGYYVVDREPTDEERLKYPSIAKLTKRAGGYNAQRTAMDNVMARAVVKAVQSTVDYPVLEVPSLGGSLPLFLFEKHLNASPVTVPIVNYDNNQHAENENVQLKFLWDGIETMAALMMIRP